MRKKEGLTTIEWLLLAVLVGVVLIIIIAGWPRDTEAQEVQPAVPVTVPYDQLSTWERILLIIDNGIDRKLNVTLAVIDQWSGPPYVHKDEENGEPDPNE